MLNDKFRHRNGICCMILLCYIYKMSTLFVLMEGSLWFIWFGSDPEEEVMAPVGMSFRRC